eukprot:g26272.t1
MDQPWPLGENLGKGFPRLSAAAVEANGLALKHLTPEMQADRDLVLKAVWQNGKALQFASKELRADRQVVLRAGDPSNRAPSATRSFGPAICVAPARCPDRMVKAYLRFEHDKAVGVVTSRECNVAFDETGRFALTGAVESVGIWNLRQGVQERPVSHR